MQQPLPRLQDMPGLVKERIAGHLDFYTDKMSLRAAFPYFHPIIGDPVFECNKLVLDYSMSGIIKLLFHQKPEDHGRKYTQKENGCQIYIRGMGTCPIVERERLVEGGNFIDLAARDFEIFVDNPNFVIGQFRVVAFPGICREEYSTIEASSLLSRIQSILMKRKLKAKEFVMKYDEDQADVLKILPYLDSNVLESLELVKKCPARNHELDEIVQLEQFRKLKKLKMFDCPELPLESWCNIPSTEMQLKHVRLEDIKRILEHFREAPGFQESWLDTEFGGRELVEAMGFDSGYNELPGTEGKNRVNVAILREIVYIQRK